MKRREFLSSAGAATVLPVLPLPAMAAPSAVASVNASQVGWAALFARANNQASTAMIQKWMGVDIAQAQTLMSELTSRNIIRAPIAGTSAAVQPMYTSKAIPGTLSSPDKLMRKAKEVIDRLAVPDDDQPGETETNQAQAGDPQLNT